MKAVMVAYIDQNDIVLDGQQSWVDVIPPEHRQAGSMRQVFVPSFKLAAYQVDAMSFRRQRFCDRHGGSADR